MAADFVWRRSRNDAVADGLKGYFLRIDHQPAPRFHTSHLVAALVYVDYFVNFVIENWIC